jgi:drug/metabolite transporter (DMT)-like permease
MNITAPQPTSSRAKVITAFAAVYIIWGSTYLAIRIAVTAFPPFLLAGCRFLLAGGLLLGWLTWRGTRLPTGRQWKEAAITGTLLLLGGNGIVCWAEQTVNSSLTALILTTTPIWFALFNTIRPGGQRPTMRTLLGLVAGFCGVLLLVFGATTHGAEPDQTSYSGIFALVAACAFWSAGSLYNKYHTDNSSLAMATVAQMLCGGLANSLVALGRGEWLTFQPTLLTFNSLAAFAYLVFFGAILGFSAYVWLLGHCSPAKVSTYAYVNPIIATFLGWLILHEPLTPTIGFAALIILGGVLMVQWPVRKQN